MAFVSDFTVFQYLKSNMIFLFQNDRSDFAYAYFASNLPSTVNTAKFEISNYDDIIRL